LGNAVRGRRNGKSSETERRRDRKGTDFGGERDWNTEGKGETGRKRQAMKSREKNKR